MQWLKRQFLVYLLGLAMVAPALGEVVRNPEGGTLFYTAVADATEEQVVAQMLKGAYQNFGAPPQLGRLLRNTRDGTLTAFFDVRSQENGKPYLGMILVAPSKGGHKVAMLYDESYRFPKTMGQMLRTLYGGSPATQRAQAAPLQAVAFPDQSAQVGVPSGWRLTYGSGGQGTVEGPRGERIVLSVGYTMVDPRSSYARYNPQAGFAPWGSDLVRSWQGALAKRLQSSGKTMPSIQVLGTHPVQAPSGWTATCMEASMDPFDGGGLRYLTVALYACQTGGGLWTIYETSIAMPQALAAQEMPTALAVVASYRCNQAVINQQTQRVLAAMNARFEAQQAAHRSQTAAFDAHNASWWAQQDSNDRRAQGFSHYLLDQTVVTDSQGRHGTFSNNAATALIKAHPNEFQEVPTSQYIKGIDYRRQ